MALLILILLLNFGISWFNAWSAGRAWPETKQQGGLPHLLSWSAATMSVCGFTSCYLVLAGVLCAAIGALDQRALEAMLGLGYLLIIGPVLGSGLVITAHSWLVFTRDRRLGSGAAAGYNTFAQLHNAYQALSAVPEALGSVGGFFAKDDDESVQGWVVKVLVVLLVVVCLLGGFLTTRLILLGAARERARELAYPLNASTTADR